MSEEFLHFIWKYRLFSQRNLSTIDGETLNILSPGTYTGDAGPDFTNARIRIGETLWVGNVEIHIFSSDWDKHRHALDKAYNNVILHVVYEHDREVRRNDRTCPPTLAIKDCIKPGLESRYLALIENASWISCEKQIGMVDEVYIQNALSRSLIARLEEKSEAIMKLVGEFKGSWDDAFYIMLARSFGFKVNALPFELLARSLPQKILARHKDNPLQIEALLFGQAGFLEQQAADDYIAALRREYRFLQKKYGLHPVEAYVWKFLRLRPQNFPTLRIAQFAALVNKSEHLFSRVLEMNDNRAIAKLFTELPVNPYWKTHYQPGKAVVSVGCQPGKASVNGILLNAVVTMLFAYGRHAGRTELEDSAIGLLESISPETNQVVRRFKAIGVSPKSAADSQALLQLKKSWCDKKIVCFVL
ncbi:DUF2851 family protein [Arcticibacter sp. MXS-1]|uniref:DUF2851 family protein n=1 Tax=Arcticibacter sp. MXS-1 TaxID=3341726 RepID=UPI0035A894E5